MRVLVTGAGGFIGHHLVKRLVADGHWVKGVDLKAPDYEISPAQEFSLLDLTFRGSALAATEGIEQVYHLAADMGGIGYITSNHSIIARNNSLMDLNILEACQLQGVKRLFFSSSACVYPQSLQLSPFSWGLKESEAYPADSEEGYGWEKLFAEKLCQYYHEDYGLEVRIARFHNVYGPLGTYQGGKEKAPAAICRKVALAQQGQIEIWGDGKQTRTFMYIDDCIEGILAIMASDYSSPINLGTDHLVTIDELVDITCWVAGKKLTKVHKLDAPQGVRGRSSNNDLIKRVLDWEPNTPLETGLKQTYKWIEEQLNANHSRRNPEHNA